MENLIALSLELDKLKSIYRKSYISDETRLENSAEHSWHLAITLLAFAPHLPQQLDIHHAVKLAICHDVCEIGAGDTCTYHCDTHTQQSELSYLESLQKQHPEFGAELKALWQEYEQLTSLESQWVRVIDKLLPFLLNIQSQGRTWQEQGISKSMILAHHQFIAAIAPEVHHWMLEQLNLAEQQGWLAKE